MPHLYERFQKLNYVLDDLIYNDVKMICAQAFKVHQPFVYK